jgi:hypothetical protein
MACTGPWATQSLGLAEGNVVGLECDVSCRDGVWPSVMSKDPNGQQLTC